MRGVGANRWPGTALALSVVPSFLAGCAAGAVTGGEAQAGPERGTADPGCVVARVPLTLGDGVFPYVEPESLIRVVSNFVVVGTPTYTWAPGTAGDSLPLTADEHLAARFTLDGRAALVEKPVAGDVGSVRAVALGGERWGVLFDEVAPDPRSGIHRTTALWWGEHDGVRWSLLERVAIPDGRYLDFHSSSEVVRTAEGLAWVVATRLPSQLSELVLYERREGAWRQGVVSDDWVESSTLAYDPEAGLWMAHFSGNPGVRRSMKVLRLGAAWELVRRFEGVVSGALVSDLAISQLQTGATVTWRVQSDVDTGAYALTGIQPGAAGSLVPLDDNALQVMALGPLGGRDAWIVTHLEASGRSAELRLLRSRPLFGAERLTATPSPYLAFLASLALEPSDVLVVGPEVSSIPADPFVRSLILRLSGSCT